jgi:hypothetical protein
MANERATDPEKTLRELLAERLENIRSQVGLATVRAFHARLAVGWASPPRERSAQNYHGATREASPAYLRRVCEVFGVRPAYLLLGEEPVFEADAKRWKIEGELAEEQDGWEAGRLEEFWAEFPELTQLPTHIRYQFLEAWSDLNSTGWYWDAVRGHLDFEIGRRVHGLLMAPFGAGRPTVLSQEFADYATAMLLALSLAVRVRFTPTSEEATTP